MENNTAGFLYLYMKNLPENTKKEIGWEDEIPEGTDDSIKQQFWENNTHAILKGYGYLRYKNEAGRSSFDRLYKIVEKEFVLKNIDLKNEDLFSLRKLVGETLSYMILNDVEVNEDVDCVKMLVLVQSCVEKLKFVPRYGEQYFSVIYSTYIDNTFNLNSEEILQIVKMSRSHYYRLKNQAICELSKIMWEE